MIQPYPAAATFDEIQRIADQQFAAGRFVAFEGDQIVGDAASHRELVQRLRSEGRSAKNLLVVQAGIANAKSAVIFLRLSGP